MKHIQTAALASILYCSLAFAGDATTLFQVSIADKDHQLVLYSNQVDVIDLTSFCQCAFVDEAKVLVQNKKEANYYLVVSMSGPSRAQMDMHYCGAGQETNIVWLKFDQKFKLLSSSNNLVDSCFKSVEISQTLDYVDGGGKMQGGFISYSEKKKYQMTYDPAAPEKGIVITSNPLD